MELKVYPFFSNFCWKTTIKPRRCNIFELVLKPETLQKVHLISTFCTYLSVVCGLIFWLYYIHEFRINPICLHVKLHVTWCLIISWLSFRSSWSLSLLWRIRPPSTPCCPGRTSTAPGGRAAEMWLLPNCCRRRWTHTFTLQNTHRRHSRGVYHRC